MENSHNLLVISSYPPKGETHHKAIVGVASYTKNTLRALNNAARAKGNDLSITVLGEILPGIPDGVDEGITVKRVWKRNRLSSYISLVKEIVQNHKETKEVVLPLEVAMFGGMLMLLFLPLFLLALRLLRKQTTVILHQVITDISDLSGHINISSPWLLRVMNLGLSFFYRTILLLASNIIVFDDALAVGLQQFAKTKTIRVIPHGVETFTTIPTKSAARDALHMKPKAVVLLYFGFISWYKGPDLLLQAYERIKQKGNHECDLIIAGGPNNNHMNKPHYQAYVKSISKKATELGADVTGFVPEKDIPTFFQAADLVILPYRTYMSASGPLSIATSLNKPFLLSATLAPTLASRDIKTALATAGISQKDLLFDSPEELATRVETITAAELAKLTTFSRELAQARSWEQIGKTYYETIFA